MKLLPYNLEPIMQIEESNINPDNEFTCYGKVICECGCKDFREKYIITERERERCRKIESIKEKYRDIFSEKGTVLTSGVKDGKESIGYYRNGKFYHLETIDYPDVPLIPSILKCECADCGKEYVLFDSSKNGYDSLTSGIVYSNDYNLRQKKCQKCNNIFEISVTIHNTGKLDLFQEGGNYITEENWTNAFDWITVDLKCSTCGKVIKRWFDYETM